ncbi:MAG: M20/M25/M40 family metallo-hydrolase, partial [Acidobacteriota bacterium]
MRPLAASVLPLLLAAQDISGPRMRADVQFLASDLLEGRGTGTRGGALAEEYIASQMDKAGLRPGWQGQWFQPVPLVGVQTLSAVELSAASLTSTLRFAWLTEFVGVTQRQQTSVDFDAEAIFVGHGITAPEFTWDDWRGLDARNKACVILANEPQSATDPKFFDGPALTYYGRWTYKFEQAARKGCAAAILVHTDQTAGYGWNVVRNSWGREEAQAKLAAAVPPAAAPPAAAPPAAALPAAALPAAAPNTLAFSGWLTTDAASKLFELDGHALAQLTSSAATRAFRPVPLRFRLQGRIPSEIRSITGRNIVGMIAGEDPLLASQAVVFTAHADHLGIDSTDPSATGDKIFNGAVDNATGIAVMLEIARSWAAAPRKPARTAIFIATTAEEAGLRGANAYVAQPAIPLASTTLNLNFDSFYPIGRVKDVILDRAERTTLWPHIERIAARYGMVVRPDPRPASGSYFRSD